MFNGLNNSWTSEKRLKVATWSKEELFLSCFTCNPPSPHFYLQRSVVQDHSYLQVGIYTWLLQASSLVWKNWAFWLPRQNSLRAMMANLWHKCQSWHATKFLVTHQHSPSPRQLLFWKACPILKLFSEIAKAPGEWGTLSCSLQKSCERAHHHSSRHNFQRSEVCEICP